MTDSVVNILYLLGKDRLIILLMFKEWSCIDMAPLVLLLH